MAEEVPEASYRDVRAMIDRPVDTWESTCVITGELEVGLLTVDVEVEARRTGRVERDDVTEFVICDREFAQDRLEQRASSVNKGKADMEIIREQARFCEITENETGYEVKFTGTWLQRSGSDVEVVEELE